MKWHVCWLTVLAFTLFALLPLACGGGEDEDDSDDDSGDDDAYGDDDASGLDDFLNAIPDPEAMRLTLPGSDKLGVKTLGEMATYYDETVDVTREVNTYVADMLGWLDEITSYDPTFFDGETAVWGPWDNGGLSPVNARFTMTNIGADSYDFVWEWRDKDAGEEDPWTTIWTGAVEASASTQRRGVGNFFIDYTTIATMDPTFDCAGHIDVDYDTLTDGRRIDIEFVDFVGEDDEDPVDALYNYHEYADLTGVFTFDFWADLSEEPEQDALEHMWFNTQWNATGDGRCDILVTDGDLPANDPPLDSLTLAECWDHDFARVYYLELAHFTGGTDWTVTEEGDANDCTLPQQTPEGN